MLTKLGFFAYSLLDVSGFLNSWAGRRLFNTAYFFYKRHFEDSFATLIERHPELFQGGDVLDAGANIGYTADLFARAVDSGSCVHAFEPEPINFGTLTRVAGKGGRAGRILAVQAAVGAAAGSISLCINAKHPGDHRVLTREFDDASRSMPRLEVPMVSLDSYVAALPTTRSFAFVKIDVQGFELAVCEGMEALVGSNPNLTVALEFMPSAMRDLGFSSLDLLRWLRDRGFLIYLLERSGNLRLSTGEITVGDRGYEDIVCRRSPIT